MESTNVIIIGAGPVGLAAALLLAKEGFKSITVYEGRDSIPNDVEESYPIGINPRTLRTLRAIDPQLEQQAIREGRIVDGWNIYGGTRLVASLASGTVYGTTRGSVNTLLYEHSKKVPSVEVKFNHKLRSFKLAQRELLFAVPNQPQLVSVVCDANTRVLAADGLYSGVRRAMEETFGAVDFPSTFDLWTSQHRVLFSKPGLRAPNALDPGYHYIFNGCYASVIKREDGQEQWTLVMGASDTKASVAERALMCTQVASEDNIAALRTMIRERAAMIAPLFVSEDKASENDAKEAHEFAEQELRRFFSRRSYRGGVVTVPRLNQGEFVALLGDAAHSVLPATGEGINSGLEDAYVLAQTLKQALQLPASARGGDFDVADGFRWFDEFNRVRHPDVHGLGQLALYLNEQQGATGARFASMLGFTICQGMLKSCGCFDHNYEDLTFGPRAVEMIPYGEIYAEWDGRRCCLLGCCTCCCYPTNLIWNLVTAPCWIPKAMWNWCCSSDSNPEYTALLEDSRKIRPTVGTI